MHISERVIARAVEASYYMKKVEDKEGEMFSLSHPGITADFLRVVEFNNLKELKALVVELKELCFTLDEQAADKHIDSTEKSRIDNCSND